MALPNGFRHHLLSSKWPVIFNIGVICIPVTIALIFEYPTVYKNHQFILMIPFIIMYIGAIGMGLEVAQEQKPENKRRANREYKYYPDDFE